MKHLKQKVKSNSEVEITSNDFAQPSKPVTIFIATDPKVAKEITTKYLSKESMPYVNMMDDITYEQATEHIDQLEEKAEVERYSRVKLNSQKHTVEVPLELWNDENHRRRQAVVEKDLAIEQAKKYVQKFLFYQTAAWILTALLVVSLFI